MSVVANVAINVDSRGAVGQLKAVQQGAVATDRAVSGLLKTVGKLTIALGAIQAVKFVFAKTAELESQTRSLEVLTGSAAKAKQIIQELQQLGAVTPFTSTELIDAAKRLQAFGVESDKVVETTRRLADVSGATGAELQGLVTAYGQVQAKGRLQGEELLQFQERGIALQGELQKMYGLSGEELRKALEKGRISAEAVEVAIIRLTDVGGKYANGAIAQSNTLNGKFSTLMDGIEMLAKGIGKALEPALKRILDLSITVIDKINQAMAGPDKKTANNQLYNTRAEIAKLKKDIAAAEKAGIKETTRGTPILGVDGQVVAGGGMVLPEMRAELKALETQAIKLENRLKELKNQSKPKPTAATPKIPPLLAEKAKDKGGIPMNQLLQTEVLQELEFKKAKEETFKQSQLIQAQQAKMNNEDLVRAKRMIDFASQYRIEQLNTIALEKQLKLINEQRAAVIASYKPNERAGVAEAIDRQRSGIANQILLTQEKTNTIAKQHYREALEAQTQQEELLKKETESQTLLGQQRKQSLTDELALAQARLAGNEAEVMLRIQIRDIMAGTAGLSQQDVTNTLNQISATKQLLTEKEKIANLVQGIGASIESGIVGAIDGAITGAKSLQESLADILKDIGKMLISFGIKSLLGSIDIGGTPLVGRASGGPVSGNSTYMVGEKGPELFVPSSSGTIIPADATAAMARYQRQGGGSGGGNSSSDAMGDGAAATPVLSMSFETTRFLGQDYVSTDQLQAAMMATERRAAAAGAKAGAAQVTSRLQQSPNYRRQVGLR